MKYGPRITFQGSPRHHANICMLWQSKGRRSTTATTVPFPAQRTGTQPLPHPTQIHASMRTALLAVLLSLAAAAAEFTATATELPPRQAHCQPRARVPRSQHAECTHLVREYMQEHTADFDAPHDVDKMLFFLHVPRTGRQFD
jgi:hypothetical protein